jgi:hypothetical protein
MSVKAKADERDNRAQQCTQSQHHENAVAQKCRQCTNGNSNDDKGHVSSPTQQPPVLSQTRKTAFFASSSRMPQRFLNSWPA